MAAFLSILRDGDILTRDRIRLWTAAILIGYAAAIVFLIVTAHGGSDYHGRPLGSDFSSFYAAGRLALNGLSPFDQAQLRHMQQALFGNDTPYYSFSYPPIFLLILTPLATLPYGAALAAWQALGLALYAAAMLRLRKRYGAMLPEAGLYLAAVFAFTATFVNLTHGQNGFLSAGLVALALSFLDESEALAGLCFGLLAFKPQLGLLVPFALAAGGYWRCFFWAAVSVTTVAVASVIAFGIGDWHGFLAAAAFSQYAILDQDAVGYHKMTSVFAALRLWGLPLGAAYTAQIAVGLLVVVAIIRTWRSGAGMRLKGAVLCLGMPLATPFALDYDLMILAPAIALLSFDGIEKGFRPFGLSLLAALWAVPILTRNVAGYTHIPLAVLLVMTAFAAVLAREGSAGIVRRTEIPA